MAITGHQGHAWPVQPYRLAVISATLLSVYHVATPMDIILTQIHVPFVVLLFRTAKSVLLAMYVYNAR